MRDRLIELLDNGNEKFINGEGDWNDLLECLADHLLAEGVIVPPVKVGQTCYKVWNRGILEVKVVSVCYEPLPAFYYTIRFNSLGVLCLMPDGSRNERYCWDIYLTREEAERALNERRENDSKRTCTDNM